MVLLGTIKNSFYILVILFLFACENNKKIQTPIVKKEIIEKKVDVPTFNADSAYIRSAADSDYIHTAADSSYLKPIKDQGTCGSCYSF